MNIEIKIANAEKLAQTMQHAPNVVAQNMRLAMRQSLREVQEVARSEHGFKTRSGNLERDIRTEFISDWEGRVFLAAETTRITEGKWAGYSYGVFVHEGTKAHDIFPRVRKALRWPINGGFAFSRHVKHPGTKDDPFLYEAGQNSRPVIDAIFNRYADRAIEEAGL